MAELKNYRVRIKNNDIEVEIESHDKDFVEEKLKSYAVIGAQNKSAYPSVETKSSGIKAVSLAKLLRDHNATTNQNMKFLGAAVYLASKGQTVLKTADVTKALRDAGQTRLANPSVCLGENIKKGHIEKTGSGFMVTVHGKELFGILDE